MLKFETTDLASAAFISVQGVEFLGCEHVTDKQAKFIFADPQSRCQKLVVDYYADKPCSARAFWRHVRVLRTSALRVVGRG